jgi:hypothetical protein
MHIKTHPAFHILQRDRVINLPSTLENGDACREIAYRETEHDDMSIRITQRTQSVELLLTADPLFQCATRHDASRHVRSIPKTELHKLVLDLNLIDVILKNRWFIRRSKKSARKYI